MSVIYHATRAHMREVGYGDDAFQRARTEVASEMATKLVREANAAHVVALGGDHKDNTSDLSCAISAQLGTIKCRDTRKAVAEVLTRHSLLDGHSSPRAFQRGLADLLG